MSFPVLSFGNVIVQKNVSNVQIENIKKGRYLSIKKRGNKIKGDIAATNLPIAEHKEIPIAL
jgi:hypothetical protein